MPLRAYMTFQIRSSNCTIKQKPICSSYTYIRDGQKIFSWQATKLIVKNKPIYPNYYGSVVHRRIAQNAIFPIVTEKKWSIGWCTHRNRTEQSIWRENEKQFVVFLQLFVYILLFIDQFLSAVKTDILQIYELTSWNLPSVALIQLWGEVYNGAFISDEFLRARWGFCEFY